MQALIQCSGVEIPPKVFHRTRKRLRESREVLGDRVERANVHVIDINGPLLGGIDKACRVVVEVRSGDAIVLEDRDANLEPLLDRITDQLDREVRRRNEQSGRLGRIVDMALRCIPSFR